MIGYILTIALGALSLILGPKMAKEMGYKTLPGRANTEFRVTYGAFFLALGILGIYFNNDTSRWIVGGAWLAAAAARAVLTLIKRKDVKDNLIGMAVDGVVGGLTLWVW